MEVFGNILKIFLALVLLFLLYMGTGAYMPCALYPLSYRQALAMDDSVQSFEKRHGRLPDFSNQADVLALNLKPGHSITPIQDGHSKSVMIDPDSPRDSDYAVNQPTELGFDGPVVTYDLASRSIGCFP